MCALVCTLRGRTPAQRKPQAAGSRAIKQLGANGAIGVEPCEAQRLLVHATTHAHTHARTARARHPQAAAASGAQLVVLPEMWNCPYSNDSFPVYAEDIDGGNCPSVDALSEVRRELGPAVMQRAWGSALGSAPVRSTRARAAPANRSSVPRAASTRWHTARAGAPHTPRRPPSRRA